MVGKRGSTSLIVGASLWMESWRFKKKKKKKKSDKFTTIVRLPEIANEQQTTSKWVVIEIRFIKHFRFNPSVNFKKLFSSPFWFLYLPSIDVYVLCQKCRNNRYHLSENAVFWSCFSKAIKSGKNLIGLIGLVVFAIYFATPLMPYFSKNSKKNLHTFRFKM